MNIANKLTISRIVLSPVFVVVYMWDSLPGRIICLLIAGAFEITDILDGHIARKTNQVSDTGKLLDPYADSVSRFTILMALAMSGYAYLWMMVLIFYNFITSAYLRVAAIKQGQVVAARISGKIKAVIQGVGILLILIGRVAEGVLTAQGTETAFPFRAIYIAIMAVITLSAVMATIEYFFASRNVLRALRDRES